MISHEREKMCFGNDASELIAEVLVQRFLPLAWRRIDTAKGNDQRLKNGV